MVSIALIAISALTFENCVKCNDEWLNYVLFAIGIVFCVLNMLFLILMIKKVKYHSKYVTNVSLDFYFYTFNFLNNVIIFKESNNTGKFK